MVVGDITMVLICHDSSGEELGRIICRRGTIMIDGEVEVYEAIYGLHAGDDINWDAVLLDEKFDNVTYSDLFHYACDFFNTKPAYSICA